MGWAAAHRNGRKSDGHIGTVSRREPDTRWGRGQVVRRRDISRGTRSSPQIFRLPKSSSVGKRLRVPDSFGHVQKDKGKESVTKANSSRYCCIICVCGQGGGGGRALRNFPDYRSDRSGLLGGGAALCVSSAYFCRLPKGIKSWLLFQASQRDRVTNSIKPPTATYSGEALIPGPTHHS